MPDYDFYHGLYSGQQVDSAVARALVGGQLDQDIAAIRAAVGSPLVANAAAEMTNINKIYVYTGSEAGYSTGHWYYYENGSWQDGGLYNSAAADSAMSDSSTNAVQNKVIKAYVDTTASELSGDIGDLRTDIDAAILAEQTRAEGVEALKAPLASPALTGTPTAPTAAAGDNSTKIATTAYADNAVAVEKARAEAVEATKADKSYADYILLREEEDRQILFGSIVEAAEDEYSELRSAPIHNAITIGQSVYPRMDRTRMAIDRMLGRTVAFNQLLNPYNSSGTDVGVTWSAVDGEVTFSATSATAQKDVQLTARPITFREGHKYLLVGFSGGSGSTWRIRLNTFGLLFSEPTIISQNASADSNVLIRVFSGATFASKTIAPNVIDLTAMYGTTLADSIYAMEQATTGAGVAYVRQRMPLDYYAANAGELVAPVVSGVSFVGFNVWDEDWEVGGIDNVTGQNDIANNRIRSKNYIPVFPNTAYYCKGYSGDMGVYGIFMFDADKNYLGYNVLTQAGFTTSMNCRFIRFRTYTGYGATYNHDICINLSNPSRNGTYLPYLSTSLSLPSTTLNGVGTAQDYIEAVEVGENDYSLILHTLTGSADLGTLNWNNNGNYWYNDSLVSVMKINDYNAVSFIISSKYTTTYPSRIVGKNAPMTIANHTAALGGLMVYTGDNVTPPSGYIVYELATPTETVIAEHLTLAEVSAIAENGGIVSVENSNGHIVQPDVVADVVISRSAS